MGRLGPDRMRKAYFRKLTFARAEAFDQHLAWLSSAGRLSGYKKAGRARNPDRDPAVISRSAASLGGRRARGKSRIKKWPRPTKIWLES
jgi:hypothetical protein